MGGALLFLRPSGVPMPDESMLAEYQLSCAMKRIYLYGRFMLDVQRLVFDIFWFLVPVWRLL